MKNIVLLVILFSSLAMAANQTINASSLTNQTLTLNASDCLIIQINNSINYTTCSAAPKTNFTLLNYSLDCLRYTDNATRNFCLIANPPNLAYVDNATGVTVVAPPFPKLERDILVKEGEINSTYYDIFGVRAIGAANINTAKLLINFSINLTAGQCYYDNVSNNTFCAKNVSLRNDLNLTLRPDQTYSNETTNLTATCIFSQLFTENGVPKIPNETQFALTNGFYCFKEAERTTCSEKYKGFCLDNLTTYCTPQELIDGNMLGCTRRVTQDSQTTIDLLKNQTNDKNTQIQQLQNTNIQCQNGQNLATQIIDNAQTVLAWFLGGLLFLAIIFVVFLYNKRRKLQTTPATIKQATETQQMVGQEVRKYIDQAFKKEKGN